MRLREQLDQWFKIIFVREDSIKRGWIGGFTINFHFNSEQLKFNVTVKIEENIKNKQKKNKAK